MAKQDILPVKFDVESMLDSIDTRYETSNGKIAKMVKGVAPLADARKDNLSFCSSNGEYGAYLISKSDAGVILCKKVFKISFLTLAIILINAIIKQKIVTESSVLIIVDNPRLAFIRVVNRIKNNDPRKGEEKMLAGISPTAVISENAKIGTNCCIGNFVVIGDNCNIGDNTIIYDRKPCTEL